MTSLPVFSFPNHFESGSSGKMVCKAAEWIVQSSRWSPGEPSRASAGGEPRPINATS